MAVFSLLDINALRLLDILREYSDPKDVKPLSKAVLLDVFESIGQLSSEILHSAEDSQKISVVQSIKHLLMSRKLNDNYLFISCLECIDTTSWAGTTPGRPAVLQAEEFERIMQLLNSPDQVISRKVRVFYIIGSNSHICTDYADYQQSRSCHH